MANPVSTDSQLAGRQRETEFDREGDWETKAATKTETLRIVVDDTDENGNTGGWQKEVGEEEADWWFEVKTKWKLEEEQGEVGQEECFGPGKWCESEKRHWRRSGPWGQGSEERQEKREQSGGSRGVQGILQTHLSPRDSLVFASGRLVINRLCSVCLTGGSLGFDGRVLISRENSRKTDRVTNRRISQKQAHCFISQQLQSTISVTPACLTLCWFFLMCTWHLTLSYPLKDIHLASWVPTVELFMLRWTLLRYSLTAYSRTSLSLLELLCSHLHPCIPKYATLSLPLIRKKKR